MSVKQALTGYAAQAPALARAYDLVSSADVFAPVMLFLPDPGALVLDVGAGTGRDAAWLAGQGYQVTAVDPVPALRADTQPVPGVVWVSDALPELAQVQGRFDLIVVAAVWQHLLPEVRPRAFARLRNLLAEGGRLVMSLRHGPGHSDRPVFEAGAAETLGMAERHGFALLHCATAPSQQPANLASGVTWIWIVLEAV